MTSMKLRRIGFALAALAASMLACNDTGDSDATPVPTATPVVVTGDMAADEIIEDTMEAADTTVSALCTVCLLAESLPGGDKAKCAICDTE